MWRGQERLVFVEGVCGDILYANDGGGGVVGRGEGFATGLSEDILPDLMQIQIDCVCRLRGERELACSVSSDSVRADLFRVTEINPCAS